MTAQLSIIIPNFRREAELLESLGHLRQQAFMGFEVVIASVGAPPAVGASEFPFAVSIVPVADEWNIGRARNAGARAARCERLFFADCDLTLPPGLARQCLGLVGAGRAWFPICRNSGSRYNADAAGWRNHGFGACGIMRADLRRLGGWDELDGWGEEDNLLVWKCGVAGLQVIRARSGIIHRDHPHLTPWHKKRAGANTRAAEARRRWLEQWRRGLIDAPTEAARFGEAREKPPATPRSAGPARRAGTVLLAGRRSVYVRAVAGPPR